MDNIGEIKVLVSGILITKSNKSLFKFWLVIIKVLAPRVTTSWRLLIDFSTKLESVNIPITVIPFSIKAIGPCFNSPAG